MKKNHHKQNLRTEAEKLKKKLAYGEEEEEDSNKTIYQKYQHLYRPKYNTSKYFEDGINEEDPFFIDVEKDEKNEKKKKKEKKIKFEAYDKRSFWGAGGEFQPHIEKKHKFGKSTCTPSLKMQRELDPEHYRANVNFIPIPKHQNKMLQLKKGNKEVDWDILFKQLDQMKDFE
eukprot:gene2955-4965_t